jgi:hypothetical protein
MLDPEEMADYEAWKQHKVTSQLDVSASAYNLEVESTALAYETGVKDAFAAVAVDINLPEVIAANPYRQPGMRGYRKVNGATTRVSGATAAFPTIPTAETRYQTIKLTYSNPNPEED